MQVYNNPQIPSASAPNFQAIKTVKCEGLYKKFPEKAQLLVDTFKMNKKAMDFCKKYDVNIVFHACEEAMDAVQSRLLIFFKNPAKKKFLGIFGSQQDKIDISGWGNAYEIKTSLRDSTRQLADHMHNFIDGIPTSGLLDQHLKLKDEEIQKALSESKIRKDNSVLVVTEAQKQREKQTLENSIDLLINSSK